MYLAQNLKYLRTKAGKQQKELALILNVSKATMAKYENGMVEPNIEMIVRMAEYFGVTLDELVLKDLKPSAPVYVSNLRYLRKKHNITQTEFAKILGFRGKQSICAIETGDVYISVDNLIKSADYFNVTLDQLAKQDLSKEAKRL